MKKKLIISLFCILLLVGCGSVKLSNGENAVITFDEGGISSEELYQLLKEKYGAENIMNLVDTYLLDKKYEDTKNQKDYVKQNVKTIEADAEKYGVSLETYISAYYNIKSKSELEDFLALNYKRNLWILDYAKETVTEKQINEYYETQVQVDIEASDILITIDASSSASDDEKKEAENNALKTANEVIEKLKNGEDFAELAKKYSKDQTSKENGGSLGTINKNDVEIEVFNSLLELSDGSYTTSPVKAADGYHVLYRTSQKEKAELNGELKETITTTIANEIKDEDGFSGKALNALREQNNMKFVDTELEKSYEDYVNSSNE